MEDAAGIPALVDAIRWTHGCDAKFVEWVDVREEHDGSIVWGGTVGVFDVTGHPATIRACAWSHATTGTKRRFVTVLHLPPIDPPPAAGRVAIAQEYRDAHR